MKNKISVFLAATVFIMFSLSMWGCKKLANPTVPAPAASNTPADTFTVTRTPVPATATFTKTSTQVPASATVTRTVTPTATRTVSRTFTATGTYTVTGTFTVTITETLYAGSPTNSPTITETATVTESYTVSETATSSHTRTVTPTSTVTNTATGTLTATMTRTATGTITLTRTASPSATITQTATPCVDGAWKSKTNSGVIFQYRVVDCGQNMECILSATGTGWVAVGWHTNTATGNGKGNNANILIGYVAGAAVVFQDQYNSSGNTHLLDSANGGVDNISNLTGTETGGITEIKFKYPLNTGTTRDIPLVVGTNYNWLFGRHTTSDDIVGTKHTNKGVIQNSPF